MNKRPAFFFLVTLLAGLTILACDTGDFVAMLSNATPTTTRTPRPTFTPRASITPTPEDTPTPEPTATNAPTAVVATKAPVVPTPRPATPKPSVPTVPPAPQFLFKVKNNDGSHGKCETGAPIFEIKGRIADTKDYVAGILAVLQGADGKIIAQRLSWGRQQMNPEWGVSCFEEKNSYNYQLDATAGRGNEPMKLFLARSATDLTPLSPPQTITFGPNGGRWYIDFYQ